MGRLLAFLAGITLGAPVAGCSAQVGVGGMINVPHDSPAQCERICAGMNTSLAAVVVMASNVGCVCNPPAPAAPTASPTGKTAAVTAGMAAVLVEEEDQQRRQSKTAPR